MKVTSFYSEGELSPIRVGSVDETVLEVKNLFFKEQIEEEEIRLEIYAGNKSTVSVVDELRLDFDRIYSKKQLRRKVFSGKYKKVNISLQTYNLPIETLLSIKNEQRYLNAHFKNYRLLVKRRWFFGKTNAFYLLAALDNNMFYLVSEIKL